MAETDISPEVIAKLKDKGYDISDDVVKLASQRKADLQSKLAKPSPFERAGSDPADPADIDQAALEQAAAETRGKANDAARAQADATVQNQYLKEMGAPPEAMNQAAAAPAAGLAPPQGQPNGPSMPPQAQPAVAQGGQQPGAGVQLASDVTAARELGGRALTPAEQSPAMAATGKAYDLSAKGLQGEAAAQAKAAQESAKILDQKNQVLQNMEDRRVARQAQWDQEYNEQVKKRDAALADYKTQEIDPGRMFHNMSTGQKITAGIGLLLGSFGGSKGNTAVEVIKDAVDRDISAQKMNLDKAGKALDAQSGILAEMRGKFQNEQQAEAAARLGIMDQIKLQVEGVAQKYKSPEVQARAQAALGQLGLQYAQTVAEFEKQVRVQQARMRLVGGGGNQTDADIMQLAATNPDEAEKLQARRVTGDGIEGFARSPDRAKAAQETVNNTQTQRTAIRDLISIGNKEGRQFYPSEAAAKARFLSTFLTSQVRHELIGGNAMTEADMHLLEGMVADPTKIRQANAKAVLLKLDQALRWKLDNTLKGEGMSAKTLDTGAPVRN